MTSHNNNNNNNSRWMTHNCKRSRMEPAAFDEGILFSALAQHSNSEVILYCLGGLYGAVSLRAACRATRRIIPAPEKLFNARSLLVKAAEEGNSEMCRVAMRKGARDPSPLIYCSFARGNNAIYRVMYEFDYESAKDWGVHLGAALRVASAFDCCEAMVDILHQDYFRPGASFEDVVYACHSAIHNKSVAALSAAIKHRKLTMEDVLDVAKLCARVGWGAGLAIAWKRAKKELDIQADIDPDYTGNCYCSFWQACHESKLLADIPDIKWP